MELIFNLTSIIQALSVSLGVGCSTLAILNFFAAIADGKIDETERRMMGVVYTVLRLAMLLILVTTAILGAITYTATDGLNFTTYVGALWLLIAVLYSNSILMTLHVVPSTIGPALQAATWYTLGVLLSLVPLGLTQFTFGQFILSYICVFLLAVGMVNGTMAYLKRRKQLNNPV